MKMNERDTTSAGRVFLKIVFQELCRTMGMAKLYERLFDGYGGLGSFVRCNYLSLATLVKTLTEKGSCYCLPLVQQDFL